MRSSTHTAARAGMDRAAAGTRAEVERVDLKFEPPAPPPPRAAQPSPPTCEAAVCYVLVRPGVSGSPRPLLVRLQAVRWRSGEVGNDTLTAASLSPRLAHCGTSASQPGKALQLRTCLHCLTDARGLPRTVASGQLQPQSHLCQGAITPKPVSLLVADYTWCKTSGPTC